MIKLQATLPLSIQGVLNLLNRLNLHLLYLNMKESKISLGAGIGLIAGIIIGNITNNVGLWIALGLCFGAGIGSVLENNNKTKPQAYTLFIQ